MLAVVDRIRALPFKLLLDFFDYGSSVFFLGHGSLVDVFRYATAAFSAATKGLAALDALVAAVAFTQPV